MNDLQFVKEQMSVLKLPYEFMEWTADDIPPVYWVGEFTETPTTTEDGSEESTMILTGTTRGKWFDLLTQADTIKRHFDPIGGLRSDTENGVIIVFFSHSLPVPTGEADLKRLQVNLTIKQWKGRK